MSKKIGLVSLAALVFVVVLVAFAGSALAAYAPGSHSNFVGGPHDVNADDPCSVCHVTHGAAQTRYLWAEVAGAVTYPAGVPSWPRDWNATDWTLPDGSYVSTSELRSSDIYLLCYSCHDGTGMGELESGPTTLGASTAFDLTKGMHRMESATFRQAAATSGGKGLALTASFGRDCDRCHDPHEDTAVRPNFIRYYQVGRTDRYVSLGPNICAGCHSEELASVTNHSHWVATYPSNSHGTVANATGQGLPINPAMVVLNPMAPGGSAFGTRLFNAALESVNNYQDSGNESGNHRLGLATLDGTGNWPSTATMKCESCHAPHGGAAVDGSPISFTVVQGDHGPAPVFDGFKNMTINTMNPAGGALCTNCHY